MPKAIKITAANKTGIEGDYSLDDGEIDDMEGLFFVADFGSEKGTYGFLNQVALDHAFIKGEDIQNGFFEVTRR